MLYTTLVRRIFTTVYGEPPEPPAESGLVLVADGVGGLDLCGPALRYVVGSAGLPLVVRTMVWGHGWGRWHADLTDTINRDAQAQAMARAVLAFRATQPDAAVFLVGKSGGSGVVARALEALPTGVVEAVVLLAPALSPRYDLTRALAAVRRELVVFWSPLDLVVLGAGTRVFGTIDRVKAVSAGLVGFRMPPQSTADTTTAAAYRKLRQIRWRPTMATTGYLGGHVGPDSPAFLRRYVVPLLRMGTAAGG